jgi:ribosome-associated protein
MDNEAVNIPKIKLDENGRPESASLAEEIYRILDSKNGEDVAVIKVSEKTDLTDYFVIATAKSTTHVRALTDEVEYRVELAGIKPDRSEGRGNGNSWMVIDYGNVLVHVFSREAREFYNLDKLYSDAEKIEINIEN